MTKVTSQTMSPEARAFFERMMRVLELRNKAISSGSSEKEFERSLSPTEKGAYHSARSEPFRTVFIRMGKLSRWPRSGTGKAEAIRNEILEFLAATNANPAQEKVEKEDGDEDLNETAAS